MERLGRKAFLLSLLLLLALSVSIAKNKDPEHDPEQIGNRAVGKGVNFYSIEKEIGLGKEMAQEAERQAKMVDDSVVTEYDCAVSAISCRATTTPQFDGREVRQLRASAVTE